MNTTKWFEKNGIIYLSVTSYGLTGKEWLERFSRTGIKVSDNLRYYFSPEDFSFRLMGDDKFKATTGIIYELAIVNTEALIPSWRDRTTNAIRMKTRPLNVVKNIEALCLLAEEFTVKEFKLMGFKRIFGLDKKISDIRNAPAGEPPLIFNLDFCRQQKVFDYDNDSQILHTYRKGAGFVFIVSETNTTSLEPAANEISP